MQTLSAEEISSNINRLSPKLGDGWKNPAAVAEAFGWSPGPERQQRLEWSGTEITAVQTSIGPEPASLFSSVATHGEVGPADLAALYAYHRATQWGVIADEMGLQPFCPQWRLGDRWYFLDKIPWSDLERNLELLKSLQPAMVQAGEPERQFLRDNPPPSTLRSIDDELVLRLDKRREEALSYTSKPIEVDRQLQSLFAKLFVLRIIEDRKLEQRVPTLQSLKVGSERINFSDVFEVFHKARELICADLFSNVDLSAIPEHTLAHIIDDLYHARNLPGELRRYNFSWIDSDVLGLAYEKYLSTVLSPIGKPAQSEFFHEREREISRHSVRKSHGVYFTPAFLTKYTAGKCIDDFFEKRQDECAIPVIIDFACGSGSFLVAAFDALVSRLSSVDPNRNWAREIIERKAIFGVDIDESAATLARLNLWNRMTEEPDPLPLPSLSKTIIAGDGLDPTTWTEFPSRFDIVLGNPPFLTTSRIHDRTKLEERFRTASGRYDYAYLFVEQAIEVSEPSGTIGMIVPNRLFRNKNAGQIRTVITEQMDLLAVVDFGSVEVFSGVGAYVGCIIARHKALLEEPAETVRVLEISELPQNFVAAFLLEAETRTEGASGYVDTFESQHPRGSLPWQLISPADRLAQMRLSEASVELGEFCEVFQGIRTGANDIYIVEVLGDQDESVVTVRNGFGDVASIEARALRPLAFGSSILKYDVIEPERALIYPYVRDMPISPGEMEEVFPLLYKYFLRYRDFLVQRSSLKGTGQSWFELIRRRDEVWLSSPKLVIRDLAPETSFAVDLDGGTFLVGGTAVIPPDEGLLMPLLGYLNSKHVNELVKRTTPHFRGNFQKFEPQHLLRIPVLNRLREDDSFADQIEMLAYAAAKSLTVSERREAEENIDHLIGNALLDEGLVDD